MRAVRVLDLASAHAPLQAGRSYYYRVCMVKDTVEMDMRGRCSAGQKVSVMDSFAGATLTSTHKGPRFDHHPVSGTAGAT